MKTLTSTLLALVMLTGTTLMTPGVAGELTAQREARTAKIESLYYSIRHGRLSRSARVEAKLHIARLEAEARKERRQQDRMRDRQAAQYCR